MKSASSDTFTTSASRNSSKPRMGRRILADSGPVKPLRSVESPARCCCSCRLQHPALLTALLESGGGTAAKTARPGDRRAENARRTRDDTASRADITMHRIAFVPRATALCIPACVGLCPSSAPLPSKEFPNMEIEALVRETGESTALHRHSQQAEVSECTRQVATHRYGTSSRPCLT